MVFPPSFWFWCIIEVAGTDSFTFYVTASMSYLSSEICVKNIVSALLLPAVTGDTMCGFSAPDENATCSAHDISHTTMGQSINAKVENVEPPHFGIL